MPVSLTRERPVCPVYHVITPGDHFSPLTGSAIPTVVHGLATGARLAGDAQWFPQNVVVQADTYTPRYASANAIEFRGSPYPSLSQRAADAARARLGLTRRAARRYYEPALASIRNARRGVVVAHNAPIVAALDGSHHHETILFAHNDVLRTYTKAEAARIVSGATRIICVSESLADEIRSHLPLSLRGRIRVVLNGVDTSQFAPASPRETATGNPRLRVLFVGRTIREKGADTLVDAVAMLPRDDIDARVVGSHGFDANADLTPYEREMRARASASRSSIQFQRFVDRDSLPALLQQADVLVVPSRWRDPCPLAVGEGLASGLVVVASRIGGIPEVIGDAGVLVAPDDPVELASALDRLADDPGARTALRDKAIALSTAHDWTWAWRHFADVLVESEPVR